MRAGDGERAGEHHRRHGGYRQPQLLQQHVQSDERNAVVSKLGGNRIHAVSDANGSGSELATWACRPRNRKSLLVF